MHYFESKVKITSVTSYKVMISYDGDYENMYKLTCTYKGKTFIVDVYEALYVSKDLNKHLKSCYRDLFSK